MWERKKSGLVHEVYIVQQGSDPSAGTVLVLSPPWVCQWENLPLEMHFAAIMED